jgi:hypothetical protein
VTDILALDIATTTGWARGKLGEQPISGSITFRKNNPAQPFGDALEHFRGLLQAKPRPDLVMIERMLPPSAFQGATGFKTFLLLAGLRGVVFSVVDRLGVELGEANVGDVRQHFISDRMAGRERAKRETVQRCRALGWQPADDNAADALAVWSYACALIDPVQALKIVPLFNRNLMRAS